MSDRDWNTLSQPSERVERRPASQLNQLRAEKEQAEREAHNANRYAERLGKTLTNETRELQRQRERAEQAQARIEELAQENKRLRELLDLALTDYAQHGSWRCSHPDRYPLDEVDPPDCPCGLHQWTIQARSALSEYNRPKEGR